MLNQKEQLGENAEIYPIRKSIGMDHVGRIVLGKRVEEVVRHTGDRVYFEQDDQAVQVKIGNWFSYKLRDRSQDGPGWQAGRLTEWPYDKEVDKVVVPSVEESTYWLDPRGCLSRKYSPEEQSFITNPFEALPDEQSSRSELINWNVQWERLIQDSEVPFPGYFSDRTIPGLRRQILERSIGVLGELGYAQLTAVPTWFHVAEMYKHLGFKYTFDEDEERVGQLRERLPHRTIRDRVVSSWTVMRQFWAEVAEKQGIEPEILIRSGKILRDQKGELLTYPLTPERNLWMYKEV
jgi:hypothetical protein